jgi:hypothetical protein
MLHAGPSALALATLFQLATTPMSCGGGGVPQPPDGAGSAATWYYTCGDPVCRGYTPSDAGPACPAGIVGQPCPRVGEQCDPRDDCNRQVVCATSDPTLQPAGCPRSRRALKQDIAYLGPEDTDRYYREALDLKLATWRYRAEGPSGRRRLGFLIDDNERLPAVDPERDMVDLYGYTSMAVAGVQAQAREIEALRREVNALRQELARLRRR